ncbi:MAG: hypothetical protein ACYTFY_12125 [Planctomycetota bacterium]|jgi:hypothetical protein
MAGCIRKLLVVLAVLAIGAEAVRADDFDLKGGKATKELVVKLVEKTCEDKTLMVQVSSSLMSLQNR